MQLGVHEFLVKPTSPRALRDRLLSIVVNPRPMVQRRKVLRAGAARQWARAILATPTMAPRMIKPTIATPPDQVDLL